MLVSRVCSPLHYLLIHSPLKASHVLSLVSPLPFPSPPSSLLPFSSFSTITSHLTSHAGFVVYSVQNSTNHEGELKFPILYASEGVHGKFRDQLNNDGPGNVSVMLEYSDSFVYFMYPLGASTYIIYYLMVADMERIIKRRKKRSFWDWNGGLGPSSRSRYWWLSFLFP